MPLESRKLGIRIRSDGTVTAKPADCIDAETNIVTAVKSIQIR